mmetsp:Transcript_12157/g.22738  ORF Transcript_12157/g.22738 Transcript_12157/m.22738 type:complete len:392 (+) Transcript_12157:201-1376(+)
MLLLEATEQPFLQLGAHSNLQRCLTLGSPCSRSAPARIVGWPGSSACFAGSWHKEWRRMTRRPMISNRNAGRSIIGNRAEAADAALGVHQQSCHSRVAAFLIIPGDIGQLCLLIRFVLDKRMHTRSLRAPRLGKRNCWFGCGGHQVLHWTTTRSYSCMCLDRLWASTRICTHQWCLVRACGQLVGPYHQPGESILDIAILHHRARTNLPPAVTSRAHCCRRHEIKTQIMMPTNDVQNILPCQHIRLVAAKVKKYVAPILMPSDFRQSSGQTYRCPDEGSSEIGRILQQMYEIPSPYRGRRRATPLTQPLTVEKSLVHSTQHATVDTEHRLHPIDRTLVLLVGIETGTSSRLHNQLLQSRSARLRCLHDHPPERLKRRCLEPLRFDVLERLC